MNRRLPAFSLCIIFAVAFAVQTVRARQLDRQIAALKQQSIEMTRAIDKPPTATGQSSDISVQPMRTDGEPAMAERLAEQTIMTVQAAISQYDQPAARPRNPRSALAGPTKSQGKSARENTAKKVKADPSRDSRLQLERAARALSDGDIVNAERLLKEGIGADRLNSKAYRMLADLYVDQGRMEDALQVYREWIAARPGEVQARLAQAALYQRLGMSGDASAALQQLWNTLDADSNAYAQVANGFRQLGLAGEEGAVLQNWTNANPGSADAHQALAQYFRRNGDYGRALTEFQAAAQLTPNNAQVLAELGTTYQQMGRHGEAQSLLTQALALTPGDLGLHMRLADAYRASGDIAAAMNTYQGVMITAPGSRQAELAARRIARLQQAPPRNAS